MELEGDREEAQRPIPDPKKIEHVEGVVQVTEYLYFVVKKQAVYDPAKPIYIVCHRLRREQIEQIELENCYYKRIQIDSILIGSDISIEFDTTPQLKPDKPYLKISDYSDLDDIQIRTSDYRCCDYVIPHTILSMDSSYAHVACTASWSNCESTTERKIGLVLEDFEVVKDNAIRTNDAVFSFEPQSATHCTPTSARSAVPSTVPTGKTTISPVQQSQSDLMHQKLRMLDAVCGLLQDPDFVRESRSFDRRNVIAKTNLLGGPPMLLLPAEIIETCGYIPRCSEKKASDALDLIANYGASQTEIFMVSHNWLRSSEGFPDSAENSKARAIIQFISWRKSWVQKQHGFSPKILFWIDYSCIDQDKPLEESGFELLPAWTACCERFLRIETSSYESRAWCRLEPFLSFAFSFADHHISIDIDYQNSWPSTGTCIYKPLLNPEKGNLFNQNDAPIVAQLTRSALICLERHGRFIEFGSTAVKCYKLSQSDELMGLVPTYHDRKDVSCSTLIPILEEKEYEEEVVEEEHEEKEEEWRSNDKKLQKSDSEHCEEHLKKGEGDVHLVSTLDAADNDGVTPFQSACDNGHASVVNLLLQAQATEDTAENDEFTPLYIPGANGHETVVNQLLQAQPTVDTSKNDGATPMHVGSQEGPSVVNL